MNMLGGATSQPKIQAADPAGKADKAKFTFRVNHPPSRPQVDDTQVEMCLIGSIKELGEWITTSPNVKTMKRNSDGDWEVSLYLPTNGDFMYQYLLKDLDGNILVEHPLRRRKNMHAESGMVDHTELNDHWGLLDSNTVEREGGCSEDAPGQPSAGWKGKETETWVAELQDHDHRDSVLPPPAFDNTKVYLARSSNAQSASGFEDCHETLEAASCPATLEAAPCDDADAAGAAMLEQAAARLSEAEMVVSGETVQRCLATPNEGRDKVVLALHALAAAVHKAISETPEGAAEQAAASEHVAGLEAELKASREALEEEKEKAAMRARRLRGSIRTAQGKMGAMRQGFAEFREEIVKMRDEAIPEMQGMGEKLQESILAVTREVQAGLDETLGKFKGEAAERRRLHNLVLTLKGNIRVFCRVRPMAGPEREAGKAVAVMTPTDTDLSITSAGKITPYNFDKVFGTESTQDQVFTETAPLVVSVLDGYNICIFAYGQTGSGKTHTMEGNVDDRGVNWRTLDMLFNQAEERRRIAKYSFKVSLMEIYNEQIKDLLETTDASGEIKKLEVKSDPATGGTQVPDLHLASVSCIEDVQQLVAFGMKNRSTSATNMNAHSSRSHCIFSVHVTCEDLLKSVTSFGKMHLIDLAGSERLSRTGATGDRLKEAQNINKSLSALGNCISALAAKQKHVPFRDSRLTHLLQDSLGVESKMLMFVCTSPCDSDATETSCSLQFAARAAAVELGTAKKRGDNGAGVMLRDAQAGMNEAKEKARAAEDRSERLEEDLLKAKAAAEVAAQDGAAKEKLKKTETDLKKAEAGAAEASKEKAARVAAEAEKDRVSKECASLKKRLEKAETLLQASKTQSRIAPPPARVGTVKAAPPARQAAVEVPVVASEEEDKENTPSELMWGTTLPDEFEASEETCADAGPEDAAPGEDAALEDAGVEAEAGEVGEAAEVKEMAEAEVKEVKDRTPKKAVLGVASPSAANLNALSLDERLARFRDKKRKDEDAKKLAEPAAPAAAAAPAGPPAKNHAVQRKTTRGRRPVSALPREAAKGGGEEDVREVKRPATAVAPRGIKKPVVAARPRRGAVDTGGWR